MCYLCIEKRGDMHRVRIPSFVLLDISELRAADMYMLPRRDVHAGKTQSIPVGTGPISVTGKCLSALRNLFSTAAGLRFVVKLT